MALHLGAVEPGQYYMHHYKVPVLVEQVNRFWRDGVVIGGWVWYYGTGRNKQYHRDGVSLHMFCKWASVPSERKRALARTRDYRERLAILQKIREAGMPVEKCSNGKWRIGNGPCIYPTQAAAERAYQAYLAQQRGKPGRGRGRPKKAQEPNDEA